MQLNSFKKSGIAVVFGSSGGVGSALVKLLSSGNTFSKVIGVNRAESKNLNFEDDKSIELLIKDIGEKYEVRLVIDATGFLHNEYQSPEKTWKSLNSQNLMHSFQVNAVGPALLMKYMLPRLPRKGKTVFSTLSARVGSIADNHSGGWYSYRASKAALNQIVRTCALEFSRTHPEGICVSLHPGTVSTKLSAPFSKSAKSIFSPDESAKYLLQVIDGLEINSNGGFYDWKGSKIPW
tara:strand:+ start:37 stop:744 length:708 start_codon:yes stop_codon:yes gene_type:complete